MFMGSAFKNVDNLYRDESISAASFGSPFYMKMLIRPTLFLNILSASNAW